MSILNIPKILKFDVSVICHIGTPPGFLIFDPGIYACDLREPGHVDLFHVVHACGWYRVDEPPDRAHH